MVIDTRNVILGVNNGFDFMLQILLQIATAIFIAQRMKFSIKDFFSKCDRIRSFKMRQKFTTKCVSCFIRKCDSFIRKCDSYYIMRRLYFKMWQLLQNATFITKCIYTSQNYFIFLKIYFQYKNLVMVDLMYQLPKRPYS